MDKNHIAAGYENVLRLTSRFFIAVQSSGNRIHRRQDNIRETMPKLDKQAMRQRRQNILEAATRQFAKQGFGSASVDDICAEAGISKGALYTHFSSKDEIMLEMIEQRGEVYDHIRASTLGELEELVFDLMLRGLSYNDSRLEMEAVTIGASNDAIKHALIANSDRCEMRIIDAIESLLQNSKAEMVQGVEPAEAASLIQTYVLGRLSYQIYETVSRDAEVRRGLAITMGGLIRPLE